VDEDLRDTPPVPEENDEIVKDSATDELPDSTFDPAMRAVAEQSAVHVRRGINLADRGAHFSARSEFIQALRMIAQALDAASDSDLHSSALSAGLKALEESDDFMPQGSRLEADLDIGQLITVHRTPILKDAVAERLSPMQARRNYYTYAQQQLATAAGAERAGSMALYGLAKVHTTLADSNRPRHAAGRFKAMALYQASVQVDSRNHMAANELGVLLAQVGQYEQALSLLSLSAQLAPSSTTWHNLAVVHTKLGQTDWADQARRHAAQVDGGQQASPSLPNIVWITPGDFSRTGPAYSGSTAAMPPGSSNAAESATPPADAKRSLLGRWPWSKSR